MNDEDLVQCVSETQEEIWASTLNPLTAENGFCAIREKFADPFSVYRRLRDLGLPVSMVGNNRDCLYEFFMEGTELLKQKIKIASWSGDYLDAVTIHWNRERRILGRGWGLEIDSWFKFC
jgi:hypothetical protein